MKFASFQRLIWVALLPVLAYAQLPVTTNGGSVNTVPKFSGTATVVNSAITESGGNVGIGTTSPGFPLTVFGGIDSFVTGASTNYTAYNPALQYPRGAFQVGYGTNDVNAGLIVCDANSSNSLQIPAVIEVNTDKNANDPNEQSFGMYVTSTYATLFTAKGDGVYGAGVPIQLTTQGAFATTPALTITSNANQFVGIGTTTPSSMLTVAGTVQSTTGGFQFPDGSVQTTAGIQTPGGSSGYNTGVGLSALQSQTTGTNDVAMGAYALKNNSTGSSNTAMGYQALSYNTTATYNTAVGAYALGSPVSSPGSNNTAIGANTLLTATGAGNVAVGYGALSGGPALQSSPGNYNIALGNMAGYNIQNGSYNIDIGNQAQSSDANVIRIGDPANQTSAYIAGINGVTISSGATVLINSNGQLGTVQSSARYKQDIQNMGESSDDLMKLRPVTFRYKQAQEDGSKPLQFGLVAEEVAKVYPELVVYGKNGQPESVQYHELPALLLNELQKQHERMEAQEQEIQLLRAQLGELRAEMRKAAESAK